MAITADVAAGGLLVTADHRLETRLAGWDLRDTTVPRAVLTVLLWFGQRGVVVVGSVLLLGWTAGRRRTIEPIVRLVVALALIAAVVYAFKLGLGRNSPRGDRLGEPAGSGASYPSGHMVNAVVLWGLAASTVRRWPGPVGLDRAVRVGRWIAPVAVFTGMLLLNYHWLSDLLGGAAIGVVVLALVLLPQWTTVAGRVDRRLRWRAPAVTRGS